MTYILTKEKQPDTITKIFLLPNTISQKLSKAFDISGCSFSPDFYAALVLSLQKTLPRNNKEYSDIVEQELIRAKLFVVLSNLFYYKRIR